MQSEFKIKSLVQLSEFLRNFTLQNKEPYPALYDELSQVIERSEMENPWFTKDFQIFALKQWSEVLREPDITSWLSAYQFKKNDLSIGIILAGNIPMVGFHDILCTLLSGNKAQIKLSSKDKYLIPFLLEFWKDLCPEIEYEFVEKLENFDAVIATGSDNTARYFEYYFKNSPHIIRKNRTSLAVLSGEESEEELEGLAEDIFTYFGMGCRNVTQLFLPTKFDPNRLFKAFYKYRYLAQHNKYKNAYDYYRAIYLLNKDEIWDNNFVLLKKSDALFAPIATLNYSYYRQWEEVQKYIKTHSDKIQLVATESKTELPDSVALGQAQHPSLDSYADGVDVMHFIETL